MLPIFELSSNGNLVACVGMYSIISDLKIIFLFLLKKKNRVAVVYEEQSVIIFLRFRKFSNLEINSLENVILAMSPALAIVVKLPGF